MPSNHEKNLLGQRFGRLIVIQKLPTKNERTMWLCRCDCGNLTEASCNKLTMGVKRSCSCYKLERIKEASTKHGGKGTPLYNVWRGIKERCYCPKNKAFKYYGGKGVEVCTEWKDDFGTFKKWAEDNGYKQGLTIDRLDNNKNYEPSNCRWTTMREQSNNKTNISKYEINGELYSLRDLSEKFNLPIDVLYYRVKRAKWSIEKAVGTPLGGKNGL